MQWWFERKRLPLSVNDQIVDVSDARLALHAQSGVYWNLELSDLSPDDSGSYLCKVRTPSGSIERSVELRVERLPPTTPQNEPRVGELVTGAIALYILQSDYSTVLYSSLLERVPSPVARALT